MAKYKAKTPTSCRECIYFAWKRYSRYDRNVADALKTIGYSTAQTRFAPYCSYYKNFHHKLTGTWTKSEFAFLREVWYMGCIKGKMRKELQ